MKKINIFAFAVLSGMAASWPTHAQALREPDGVRMAGHEKSAATRAECSDIEKYLDDLDNMARNPHSAHGQDWIKREKEKARARQFELNC